MGYQFTTKIAKKASRRSARARQHTKLYIASRKRNGRYEYLIRDPDGTERWVSRQAIYHMQHAHEMAAMGRDEWLELRRLQAEERQQQEQDRQHLLLELQQLQAEQREMRRLQAEERRARVAAASVLAAQRRQKKLEGHARWIERRRIAAQRRQERLERHVRWEQQRRAAAQRRQDKLERRLRAERLKAKKVA